MRSIRPLAAVIAVAVAALTTGCDKPNLNDTGGGYGPRATSSAEADTGRIAPPSEGADPGAPVDR